MKKPISLPPNSLPDNITLYPNCFMYKKKKIFYNKIRSIRIYSEVQKMTMNLMPMPTNVSTKLEIYLTNSEDKIKIFLHFLRFGFKRKKKEEKYRNIIAFCLLLEKMSFNNRLDNYLKSETSVILFKYIEQGIFNNQFNILKDGRIQKNGKDFASFDENEYDIFRSYKKIHFVKKKRIWFGNNERELDISRDEDVFLFILERLFKLTVPFVERTE
tara:strand:+ start:96 stop:740 length:645 start_codon:yes stop_codon:yes gene_type:complete